jgi:glycosyltransferase involved in cell wall biosynthesis
MIYVVKKIFLFNPNVIYLVSVYPWVCIFLPILKAKFIIISTIHDPKLHFGEERIDKEIIHYIAQRFSDIIFVHGEYIKQIVINKWNVPINKVHSIPHGDYSIIKKWQKKDVIMEKNSILFFGRIEPYKGLQYLLKSRFLLLNKYPNLKIIIAGKGDLAIYRLPLNDISLEIHNDFIPIEEIPELFQRASIVVLPYIDASQSGVVSLAFTFNKPVISTNVGSIPEIVVHDKTGLIVPPYDARELAKAIEKIFEDGELRNRLEKNIFEYTQKELSWLKISEKIISCFNSLNRKRLN